MGGSCAQVFACPGLGCDGFVAGGALLDRGDAHGIADFNGVDVLVGFIFGSERERIYETVPLVLSLIHI